MRKLNLNERLIKEYKTFILIEVQCPNGKKYRTTIDKFVPRDTKYVSKKKYEYTNQGYAKRGFYHEF